MKVGDEYYTVWVNVEEGETDLELWIITAIREGRVFACRKTSYTWVRRSSKTGDYGWARLIGAYNRHVFKLGDVPATWAKTKAAAYTKALPEIEVALKRLTKLRAQLTGQRTRLRTKAAKP